MNDESGVRDSKVQEDICTAIMGPSGEAKHYMEAMAEYISDWSNYPALSSVDLDALIDLAQKEEL